MGFFIYARLVELVDTQVLGTCALQHESSSLSSGTNASVVELVDTLGLSPSAH